MEIQYQASRTSLILYWKGKLLNRSWLSGENLGKMTMLVQTRSSGEPARQSRTSHRTAFGTLVRSSHSIFTGVARMEEEKYDMSTVML